MEKLIKSNAKQVFVVWLISVLCYLPFIANGLTNSVDGLWAPTYYQSGNIELTSGRWFLLFLDKGRGAYAAEPFSSFFALFFISISVIIIIKMFSEINYKSYIYGVLIPCSTTICCYLAYRFTSANYGLSILLATCAARLTTSDCDDKKKSIKRTIVTFCLMVLCLGIYQANLGCFIVLVLMYMLKQILNFENSKCLKVFKRMILVCLCSCIIYKIAWDICLVARHCEASNYNGADSVSIKSILMGLPYSIGLIYRSWFGFFSFESSNYVFRPVREAIALIILVLVLSIGIIRLRHNVKSLIAYIVVCLFIPIGANVAVILAPATKAILTQMTAPMMIVIPIALMYLEGLDFKTKKILGLLGAILLYGNIYAVGTDIDALSQGSNSTYAIMNNIVTSLNERELLSEEYEYAFYGNISANKLFKTNQLYEDATHYAKFGTLMTKPDMVRNAYMGLFADIGIDLKSVEYDDYVDILDDGLLDAMPVYPAEGSIVEKNGLIIVKVSEDYK